MDITKCKGEGCSRKDKCLRFTSPSSGGWQSWFKGTPKGCNYFLATKAKKTIDRKKEA